MLIHISLDSLSNEWKREENGMPEDPDAKGSHLVKSNKIFPECLPPQPNSCRLAKVFQTSLLQPIQLNQ